MSPADWKFVLENHNKEFEGHILKKGEKLVSSFGRSKDLLVKEDRVLKERSMLALKAQAKRWGLFTKAFAGVKDGQAEMDTDTETDEVSSD